MSERPAAEPEDAESEGSTTPTSIRVVLAFLIVSTASNIAGAVGSVLLLLAPAEAQTLFGAPVSDWFWALCALLFACLAIVYAVVIRAVLRRDAGAGLAVSVLGLLGVGYSLLSITHLYGWGVLAVSIGMLAANQTGAAQDYYSGHALSLRRR